MFIDIVFAARVGGVSCKERFVVSIIQFEEGHIYWWNCCVGGWVSGMALGAANEITI